MEALKRVLSAENTSIDKVLLTHWHLDHVGGVEDLRRFSPRTTFFKNQAGEGQHEIRHGQQFHIPGSTLRAIHCPGHTTDHMAFVLEEEDAM